MAACAPRHDPGGADGGRFVTTGSDAWSTPERVALRALTRDFTIREVVPYLDDWEAAGELPRSLHAKAAAAGLLGVAFPESAGGQGGNAIDSAIVSEEMLYAGASSGLL